MAPFPFAAMRRISPLAVAAILLLSLEACDCNSGTTPQQDGRPDLGPGDARTEGGTPQSPHGILGRHSALVAGSGTLMVSAYEAKFGDLVLVTASTSDLSSLTKQVVDGVPATASPPDPGSYRDGITGEGDDVGYATDIVVGAEGEPMISYHDATNRALKFAVRAGDKWTVHTVQAPADTREVVGHHTAMALVNGFPGVAFLVLNIDGGGGTFKSELRWAASNKKAPSSDTDWSITTIASGTMSCQNLCAADEACVPQQDGTSVCQKTDTGCDPQCAATEACISGTCTTIIPEVKYVDIPAATGLWPAVVEVGGAPIVLFHDRVNGNLMGATRDAGAWKTAVVDGAADDNVGAYPCAAVDSANTVHVAYQDSRKSALLYAQVDAATLQAQLKETVDDGVRTDGLHPVGADSAMIIDPAGKVRLVYQDAQTADLLAVTRSGPGSWTPAQAGDPHLGRLLKGGARGYGFYSDLALDGGKVYGSTFFFDQTTVPKGGLELFALP